MSQCNKQTAYSSNQIKQEPDALFEATGYPLTGDIPILNRKVNMFTDFYKKVHTNIVFWFCISFFFMLQIFIFI